MKKIMPTVAMIFFAIFGVGIIALLMSYTFEALGYVFPGNFISQIMGMVLFDIALLAWLLAFIYLSKSVGQYAITFIGFLVGLAGTLGMVAIDVMMGGQNLVAVPDGLEETLIYGFIAAACAHALLIYSYKLADPDIAAQISLGVETALIIAEAEKQAEKFLLAERSALGALMAPRLLNSVRERLGLPYEVIDLPALDVDKKPEEPKEGLLDRISAAFKRAPVTVPSPVASAAPPTPSPVDHPFKLNNADVDSLPALSEVSDKPTPFQPGE